MVNSERLWGQISDSNELQPIIVYGDPTFNLYLVQSRRVVANGDGQQGKAAKEGTV